MTRLEERRIIMGFITWIIFGALVGWVASIIMKKNASMGLIANIIVGLVGSVIGGWVGTFLGLGTVDTFSLSSFLIALLGAVILLAIVNAITARK